MEISAWNSRHAGRPLPEGLLLFWINAAHQTRLRQVGYYSEGLEQTARSRDQLEARTDRSVTGSAWLGGPRHQLPCRHRAHYPRYRA
jgi:hypothetical protein